jgi:carbamoyl-phosphate synthase large subunit
MRLQMRLMALELGVVGLMNAQFALRRGEVFVLEVNPRASRTVPFVSKATGVPLAAIAARVMAGKTLKEQGYTREIIPNFYSVKEAVFPFIKFPGVDPILGPEMRSTGEVMGIGWSFGGARAKSMKAANYGLPRPGKAFLSVRDADKEVLIPIARELIGRGYELVATAGTAIFLNEHYIECESVNKVMEGRPHIVDLIKNDEINFIVNTTEGAQAISDSFSIRREALQRKVSYTTTIAGGRATLRALDHEEDYTVHSLQQLHKGLEV